MTRLQSGVVVVVVAALLVAVPAAVVMAQGRPNETGAGGGGGGGTGNPGGGGGATMNGGGGGGSAAGGGAAMGSSGGMSSGGASSGGSAGWSGGSSNMGSGSGYNGGNAPAYGEPRRTGGARERVASESPAVPAAPWYSRPRGENPAVGTAAARPASPVTPGGGGAPNGVDYTPYGPIYGSFYGYAVPLGYLGYGYGWGGYGNYGYGMNYGGMYSGYYDPFWSPYGYGYGGYGGYGGEYGGGSGWSTPRGFGTPQGAFGYVRLKVKPANATVYVDGYYSGRVDDFDGLFQKLKLEAGPHKVEISAPGYKSVSFEVNIRPGETINFQNALEIVK